MKEIHRAEMGDMTGIFSHHTNRALWAGTFLCCNNQSALLQSTSHLQ